MSNEKCEVKLFEHIKRNNGWVIWFFAAAERRCDLGLLTGGGEEIVGHVLDEDAFALDDNGKYQSQEIVFEDRLRNGKSKFAHFEIIKGPTNNNLVKSCNMQDSYR